MEYPQVQHRVRGVFKGGGAKGLVYCGALHELRARGIWFRSVAGSSAGAITSMLIACGLEPVALTELADDALVQVRRNLVRWLIPAGEKAVFKTSHLHAWLEARAQAAIGVQDRPEPVTFAEFEAAGHGIELNVVALDLATQQPIVFNATTTPACSVSAAVIASSAIPVVMPTQRVLHRQGEKRSVHRIVDGGAWANYPTFVYRDRSFRRFHGLEPVSASEDVLGFVIEGQPYRLPPEDDTASDASVSWPPPPPEFPSRDLTVLTAEPRASLFDRGSARRMGFVGALASWTVLRWAATVLVAGGFLVVAPRLWITLVRDDFEALDGLAVSIRAPVIMLAYMTLVVAVVSSVALVVAQARFASEAVDNGIPSVNATLSVGPSVPAWVGYDSDDHVIRLSAPLGIETTSFSASPVQRSMALMVSGSQASAQLDQRFPERPRAALPQASDLAPVPNAGVLEGAALYRALGGGPLEAAAGPQGESTFVLWFWMMLLGSPAPYYASVGEFFIGVVIMAFFVLKFAGRALRGRQLNVSALSDDIPARLRVVRRAFLGVALVVTGATFLNVSEQSGDELPTWFFTVSFGFLVLFGAGCICSAASRAFANRQRQRYVRELADL